MMNLGFICLGIFMLFAYKTSTRLIGRKLRATLTALDDLELLGIPRSDKQKIQGTAVICGGSIGGLLAARVCSDHFEQVIIVEPEGWVATEEGLHDRHRQAFSDPSVKKRSRVAQYTAVHAFQPFMLLALRKLFECFEREIEREGARVLPADSAIHISGVPLLAPYHQYPNRALPQTMYVTRPVFETVLRRLVLSTCVNVKYITASVSAIVPHPSKHVIEAVILRTCEGKEIIISATLVVDCTGPSIGGLRWLQDSTFGTDDTSNISQSSLALRNLKTTYDPKMLYTTCEFDVTPTTAERLKHIGLPSDYERTGYFYSFVPDPKKNKRVLVITRREKHYLQIACGGWNEHTSVRSVSDIASFVHGITSSRPLPKWIYSMLEILREDEVPGTYVRNRMPPSTYVQYYRAVNLPYNFVALGDAVLLLNPAKGLGCTKACVDAVTLNSILAQQVTGASLGRNGDVSIIPNNFGRDFFSSQAKRTGALWEAFKANDYAMKGTVPAPGDDLTISGAWRRWYSSEITKLALKDRDVAGVMWHTTNWLAPQTDLFFPWILRKLAFMVLGRFLSAPFS